MKLTTINQVIETILDRDDDHAPQRKVIANEAVIYWKTFWIAEHNGIDEAMKYFSGGHSEHEYQEYRTGVIKNDHNN